MPYKSVANNGSQTVRRSVRRSGLEVQAPPIIPFRENSPFALGANITPGIALVYMSNEYWPIGDAQFDSNPV